MRTASADILTPTARLKLRVGLHCVSIAPCKVLGYYRGAVGSGRWVVRMEIGRTQTGCGIRRHRRLGLADDFVTANGKDILSYEQAMYRAIEWTNDQPPRLDNLQLAILNRVLRDMSRVTRHGDRSQRHAVLERDGYSCKLCGRSPQAHGVVVEVDHIVPRSKGGRDVIANMQTLCEDCNRGKGAKRADLSLGR